MREFLRRAHSPDVRCVEEDLVARVEHRRQSSSAVVVLFHVVLCLADRRLRFFDRCSHSLHEFVDRLQTGGVSSGFEAHAGEPSGVEQERRVLSSGVDVIVVLELCQG